MPTIFQITPEMVERSSTLEPQDIGLWCFIVRGCYHGFCPTKGEAYLKAKAIFTDQVELRNQIVSFEVLSMVAINPMRGRAKQQSFAQLTFNFFSNPHQLELDECDELINLRRLAKWREKDAKSDS